MSMFDKRIRRGRLTQLPEETKKLVLEVEQAREEGKEEAVNNLKLVLKKEPSICGAYQYNGKICLEPPHNREDGSTNGRCARHGGASTGAVTEKGRKNSLANLDPNANLIHGVYSSKFKDMLTQEEVDFYNTNVEWFIGECNGDISPVDIAMLDRYIMNFIKQARKDSANFLDESPSYNDFETKMIRFAESLGINRKFKMSKDNKDNVQRIDIATLLSGDLNKE